MAWTAKSKNHIDHLLDLERMLLSSPKREYAPDAEPSGFLDYWNSVFAELYVVSCLIYLMLLDKSV